mmetsp:Transcript_46/g.121  ORF Transcript_46/g.121 Transcript_46/m.121 type:complete len:105 (+) Transcript_46:4433-4747(+)
MPFTLCSSKSQKRTLSSNTGGTTKKKFQQNIRENVQAICDVVPCNIFVYRAGNPLEKYLASIYRPWPVFINLKAKKVHHATCYYQRKPQEKPKGFSWTRNSTFR